MKMSHCPWLKCTFDNRKPNKITIGKTCDDSFYNFGTKFPATKAVCWNTNKYNISI